MIIKNFSDIENYLKYLDKQESNNVLKTINYMIVKHLSEQNNVDILAVLNKFVSFLSEDNHAKLIMEIDQLIFNQLNQEKRTEPPGFENAHISSQNNFHSRVGSLNLNLKANIPPNNLNEPKPVNINRPPRPPEPAKNFIHISEGIKFLIPTLTIKGKKALADLSTPMELYSLLKLIDGRDSLEQLFIKAGTHDTNNHLLIGSDMKTLVKDMQGHFVINFIEKIVKLYKDGYVTCIKSINLPYDKNFKMRLGDLIVYMGLISQDKLEKTIEFQRSGRVIGPVENNFAQYNSQKNTRLLIGDLLLSMNLINKIQLDKALLIQRWYNNIV